jgi:hypothetical protein
LVGGISQGNGLCAMIKECPFNAIQVRTVGRDGDLDHVWFAGSKPQFNAMGFYTPSFFSK